jgi:hypothetical protein
MAIELDLSAAGANDRSGRSDSQNRRGLEVFTIEKPRNIMLRRRDPLLAVSASGVAAAASATSIGSTRSSALLRRDKRKPQYQASSPEVQTFYLVNRYPGK